MAEKTQRSESSTDRGGKTKAQTPAPMGGPESEEERPGTILRRAGTNLGGVTPTGMHGLQRTIGNQAVGRLAIQAKLTVGAANDPAEHEADSVAQRVVSMPEPHPATAVNGQTKEEDETKGQPPTGPVTPVVRRASSDPRGSFEPGSHFEGRLKKGGGSPLPSATRAFMEPRFGADFGGVRLHTGGESAELNRAIDAKAFTHGQDIYLGEGKHDVESGEGKQLLAHELTHTIQQGGAVRRSPPDAGSPAAPAAPVPPNADDFDALIRKGDWHGAAWTLAQGDDAAIAQRVASISPAYRANLVEGARFGTGRWDTQKIISAVDKVGHRDMIIGSVRYFVWMHLWGPAGEYLCGLESNDMRQFVMSLHLTVADMLAMADGQAGKAQRDRLNVELIGNAAVYKGAAPPVLVDKGGEKVVEGWLAGDPLVAPYASKKFAAGGSIVGHLHVIPIDKWNDVFAEHEAGRNDPQLGRARTPAESRIRAVSVDGFADQGELYFRQGSNTPDTVIHEAIHFLAPNDFTSLYGSPVNEGITEYFSRHVALTARQHPSNAYPEQYAGAAALAQLVGDDLLANAFFSGKGFAVQNAVDAARGQGTFSNWVDAMKDDKRRKDAPDILKAATATKDAGP